MKKKRTLLYVILIITIILIASLSILFFCFYQNNNKNIGYSIDLLTNINTSAVCSIDYINNIDVRNIGIPITIYTNQLIYKKNYIRSNEKNLYLEIKGWAIDPIANSAAGDVFIDINKNHFKAKNGLPITNNQNISNQVVNSGFVCSIPLSELSYFPMKLTLKVVNERKSGYYVSPKTYNILIMDSPLPLLKDIVQLDQTTRYNIDIFGSGQFSKNSTTIITRNSPYLTITGWAIDYTEGYIAGGVYISIDSNDIQAVYGFERMDVAEFMGNYQYTFSGFQAYIPFDSLSNGIHTASVKILKYNKMAFYSPDKEFQFEIQ